MFRLYADKNKLALLEREPLTSGSVNIYEARFEFSADWDGLERVAVFEAGGTSREVLLDDSGTCVVPWEVLIEQIRRSNPRVRLLAGVYGTRGGEIVLPTVWADLGAILEGVPTNGDEARPPTPDLWEQELAKKGDGLGYTEAGELGLYSGEKLLGAVPVSGGGGGMAYGVGHGLKVVNGDLTVNAVNDFKGDNTLPMTAAGVDLVVGNIEALLTTI